MIAPLSEKIKYTDAIQEVCRSAISQSLTHSGISGKYLDGTSDATRSLRAAYFTHCELPQSDLSDTRARRYLWRSLCVIYPPLFSTNDDSKRSRLQARYWPWHWPLLKCLRRCRNIHNRLVIWPGALKHSTLLGPQGTGPRIGEKIIWGTSCSLSIRCAAYNNTALKPGMTISNGTHPFPLFCAQIYQKGAESGHYSDGGYGTRTENVVVIQ